MARREMDPKFEIPKFTRNLLEKLTTKMAIKAKELWAKELREQEYLRLEHDPMKCPNMAPIRRNYQSLGSYGIDANLLPVEWKEGEPELDANSRERARLLMKYLPAKMSRKEKEKVWLEMRKREERNRKEAVNGLKTYKVDHFMAPPGKMCPNKLLTQGEVVRINSRRPFYKFAPGWQQYVCTVNKQGIPMPTDRADRQRVPKPKRLFYYHKSSKVFQWQNPKLLHFKLFNGYPRKSEVLSDKSKLPQGWTVGKERSTGRPVYHNKPDGYCTYADPRSLKVRREMLQELVLKNAQKSQQDLWVDEEQYFDSVYLQLASWSTMEFHFRTGWENGLYCKQSLSSVAQDVGGVTNQVFTQMAIEWTHPDLRMFEYREAHANWEIDPLSTSELFYGGPIKMPANILKHFYVFGRFLGLALWYEVCLGQTFGLTVLGPLRGFDSISRSLFEWRENNVDAEQRHILLKALKLYEEIGENADKIEQMNDNLALFDSLSHYIKLPTDVNVSLVNEKGIQVKENTEFQAFDYFFAGNNLFENAPIVEKGKKMPSTAIIERNEFWKSRLARLKDSTAEFFFKWSFYYQAQAMKNGFKDVLPLEWCRLFDFYELQQILGGKFGIDYDDWMKNNTWSWDSSLQRVSAKNRREFQTIFWNQLTDLMKEDGMKATGFLRFLTGRNRPPIEGFGGADSSTTMEMVSIVYGKPNINFKANTCFSTLLLKYPAYEESVASGNTPSQAIANILENIMVEATCGDVSMDAV